MLFKNTLLQTVFLAILSTGEVIYTVWW